MSKHSKEVIRVQLVGGIHDGARYNITPDEGVEQLDWIRVPDHELKLGETVDPEKTLLYDRTDEVDRNGAMIYRFRKPT